MEEQLRTFLQTNFNPRADNVIFIGEGWFSQAFAFNVNDQKLIARLNEHVEDFLKDEFAHAHFTTVPIPNVIWIGRFDEKRFVAITERCAGEALKESGNPITVTPSLFKTLDALRQLDTASYTGWGLTDSRGTGQFESWGGYLLSLYNQKFDYDWRTLIHNSFIERDLFQAYYDEMQRLLAYCPREKYVVHGDYGFTNVVADGDKVTGVLDWAEWKLGDFLYDVMYLDFWSDDIPYGSLWRAEHTTLHFGERMRCYTLHQGLGTMAIAAVKKDEGMYTRVKERMVRKLNFGSVDQTE
jgi:hygromycin-B 4-O-kinase